MKPSIFKNKEINPIDHNKKSTYIKQVNENIKEKLNEIFNYKYPFNIKVHIKTINKDRVEAILSTYNIKLENNQLYDHVYVANMIIADFLGESIDDESHMAKHIKAVIDDTDGYDGIVFTRWYADMRAKGIPVDWEEML